MRARAWASFAAGCLLMAGCQAGSQQPPQDSSTQSAHESGQEDMTEPNTTEPVPGTSLSSTIPPELEEIPDGYEQPSDQPGRLVPLTYESYESFSYETGEQVLTKTAWVYLPFGYTEDEQYNVLYLSHGGWSNETTLMGTDTSPTRFKNAVDHGIADGLIKPLIIVLPTYNNTSPTDSANFSLALSLTDNFHRELVNDLIPAVESTYSSFAPDTTAAGLRASRDHRAFGGFSMGSVNTWRTFQYSLDYFRYFMPMSGSLATGAELLATSVADSGRSAEDFFIYAMTGTDDFAYAGFRGQIEAMTALPGGPFIAGDSETTGNLAYREREGYSHDAAAADEYTFNGLRFFWNGADPATAGASADDTQAGHALDAPFTSSTTVAEVVEDPDFGEYGRLIFPADASIPLDLTLAQASSLFPWYADLNTDRTVSIVNDLHARARAAEPVFIEIYSGEELREDPEKEDTGLFFFPGNPGGRTAIVSAGGGFAYVGAMADSFPQAQELATRGINAFALIYRPGAQTGAEDLARAIAVAHQEAERLEITMTDYSLWGGSAGARLAAWVGSNGTEAYGQERFPRPATVITQYTGLSEVTGEEPPTYACVGTEDPIASPAVMRRRIEAIQANGTPARIDIFDGLPHGFGLGEQTAAQGWIDNALAFWSQNLTEPQAVPTARTTTGGTS